MDSATVIALGHRALGGRLRTAFVDNGLMREGEPEQIQTAFGRLGFPPKPPSTMEAF